MGSHHPELGERTARASDSNANPVLAQETSVRDGEEGGPGVFGGGVDGRGGEEDAGCLFAILVAIGSVLQAVALGVAYLEIREIDST